MCIKYAIASAALMLAWTPQVLAQQQEAAAPAPCREDIHAQFDFWVGDWQVFKRETGELAGIDLIEKVLEGCALQQTWIQLDDGFRPSADQRLRGLGVLSVTQDERWRMSWSDNSGYTNVLTGALTETGAMVLDSDPVRYPRGDGGFVEVYFRWHWLPQDADTVRSWGERRIGEDGAWETSFDNIYRRNR